MGSETLEAEAQPWLGVKGKMWPGSRDPGRDFRRPRVQTDLSKATNGSPGTVTGPESGPVLVQPDLRDRKLALHLCDTLYLLNGFPRKPRWQPPVLVG
jgi:hypothetical protein